MSENNEEKKAIKEGVVQKTTDYGQFKYIESNRTVNKNHVQHLIQSFENNPDLVQTRPILVNEDMEVIDGQHRLQACMALRIPVWYMIASGTNVESAQLMNALQRGWSLIDFARSYALQNGNAERSATYKSFLQLFEEYRMPVGLLVVFCEQRQRHGLNVEFKKGNLRIKDLKQTREWLNMVEDVDEIVPREVSTRSSFNHALFTVFRADGYDHERMIKKFKEKRITPQLDKMSYLREIERIYNDSLAEEKKIRLF